MLQGPWHFGCGEAAVVDDRRDLNNTALSNLHRFVCTPRKEQRREVLYPQACRENQRGAGVFRPRDLARSSAHGRRGLLFDVVVLQADCPEPEAAAPGLVEFQGGGPLVRGEVERPRPKAGHRGGPLLPAFALAPAHGGKRPPRGGARRHYRRLGMRLWDDGNLLHLPGLFRRGRAQGAPDRRVCKVLYFYQMDRDFGLMHVKIQTWFPFTMQVYVKGHEWRARKLSGAGIAFENLDNAFLGLGDVERAGECARGFWRRDWPSLLDALARRVNPHLADGLAGQSCYWVIDEAEFSTDVLFADRAALAALRPRLFERGAWCFGAERVMTFLGRKYRATFQGDVRTRWHRREPGAAVKHWVKGNALKMYDKAGAVLRIETVINNPREFFVHRPREKHNGTTEVGWFPMNKGVANLYRYAQVGQQANARYLEALAVVGDLGVGQRELDRRCAPVRFQGRRRRALQPLSRDDQALFRAALRGEYAVRGFRNGELAQQLFGSRPNDPVERRRRCGRVSRRISLLRAHGLVAKVPRSRRYHVTPRGQRFMSTAVHLHTTLFPKELTPSV